MDTSPHYIGDTDQRLIMDVQEPLYKHLVRYFFDLPKERFIESCQLFNIHSRLLQFIYSHLSFNYGIYNSPYNLMAAYFRHSYHELVKDRRIFFPDFPYDMVTTGYIRDYDETLLLQDCYQGDLFKPKGDLIKCLKKNWVKFMYHEVLRLTYKNKNFTLASVVAALCNCLLRRIDNVPVINPNLTIVYTKEVISRLNYAIDIMGVIILNEYHMHDWIREDLLQTHKDIIDCSDSFKTLQEYLDDEFWFSLFGSVMSSSTGFGENYTK